MPPLFTIAFISPVPSSTAMVAVLVNLFMTIIVSLVMRRTPTPASPIPAGPPKELPPEPSTYHLHMDEVTIAATIAAILLKLAAHCLAKIRYRREFCNNRASTIEATLKSLQGGGSFVLLLKLNINVAYHVIGKVVAEVEALELAEHAELLEDVLVEILEMFLDLAGVKELLPFWVDCGGGHLEPLVHIAKEESWGDGGAVMETRATIAVTTSSDLEVERTVHAVFLCSVNRSQVLRHFQSKLDCYRFLGLRIRIRDYC